MLTIWHPHTKKPEQGTTAIIAHRDPGAEHGELPLILYGGLHMFEQGQWVSEDGGVPLAESEFWWASEGALLALVPNTEAEAA